MTNEIDEQELIYICSWFETKRHKKSHTDMYFKELKDTLWVFDTYDYNHGLARVEVIKVSKNSYEYDDAISNIDGKKILKKILINRLERDFK